jgi:glycosyltransferase involved in cell wall biosynthesis
VSGLGPNSISACVVARNEEALIDRCLRSLDGVVDEVVLVHSGECGDRTLEIAEAHGCRVFTGPDGGHGEHNTPLAYARARGEWLLNVDADEFLSAGLRARLRELVADPAVNGYAFIWPVWDGRRYLTRSGPYKLVLFRRSATRMVGLIHSPERVEGEVREVPLVLEHRSAYDPYSLATVATKWRRWARIQAQEYLGDLDRVPSFGYERPLRWSRRRRLQNALAPLLVVPAALHTFGYVVRAERRHLAGLQLLRYAGYAALYRAMVTAYVARLRWLP